jgi:hypothetical protein
MGRSKFAGQLATQALPRAHIWVGSDPQFLGAHHRAQDLELRQIVAEIAAKRRDQARPARTTLSQTTIPFSVIAAATRPPAVSTPRTAHRRAASATSAPVIMRVSG